MKELLARHAKVLIIGGGGREHAIGLRLVTDGISHLCFAPGNAGTASIGVNLDETLDPNNFEAICEFVTHCGISLVVIGPEAPLAAGLVDYLRDKNIPVIGPTQAAAKLESSKIFARELMAEKNIPQPSYAVCSNWDAAVAELREHTQMGGGSIVIKVDGLAAGKGVFVCHDHEDIYYAMEAVYEDKKFGDTKIIIEECLEGTEMSLFALCDQSGYVVLGTAQDYKRLLDGNHGPNTGGMGSIAPSPLETPELIAKVEDRIIKPILQAMNERGAPFTGFLYCGLMIKDGEPYVIEFNVRLGDPETQVILPLIENNFFDLLWLAAHDQVATAKISCSELCAACVIKVAQGYPEQYPKGEIISGHPESKRVIHAGTKLNAKGQAVTNGGRVLGVVGINYGLAGAIKNAYSLIRCAEFSNEFYRRDIGGEYLPE